MEVRFGCCCCCCFTVLHVEAHDAKKHVNNQLHGLSRRLCLQRWSFCNFAATGGEPGGLSWKRYFLRRCHLEATMTKGRSGGYACKSLRGHTGRKEFDKCPWLCPSCYNLIASVVHQAGWWVWRTCRGVRPTFRTCGTSAPRSAAAPPMAQSERGTSKLSVEYHQHIWCFKS